MSIIGRCVVLQESLEPLTSTDCFAAHPASMFEARHAWLFLEVWLLMTRPTWGATPATTECTRRAKRSLNDADDAYLLVNTMVPGLGPL